PGEEIGVDVAADQAEATAAHSGHLRPQTVLVLADIVFVDEADKLRPLAAGYPSRNDGNTSAVADEFAAFHHMRGEMAYGRAVEAEAEVADLVEIDIYGSRKLAGVVEHTIASGVICDRHLVLDLFDPFQ